MLDFLWHALYVSSFFDLFDTQNKMIFVIFIYIFYRLGHNVKS